MFCACLVAIKEDLFLALFFALFLRMLIGVEKKTGFWYAIDDTTSNGKLVKPVK